MIPFARFFLSVFGLLHSTDVASKLVSHHGKESRLVGGKHPALQAHHVTCIAMLKLHFKALWQRGRREADAAEDAAVARLRARCPTILHNKPEVREGLRGVKRANRFAFADDHAVTHGPHSVARHSGICEDVLPGGNVATVEEFAGGAIGADVGIAARGAGQKHRCAGALDESKVFHAGDM